MIMMLIVYSAITVPVRVCFSEEAEGAMWIFEVSVTLFFITDLMFTFNTAYIEEGVWIVARSAIASRYLTGWFWIDAPSSIPIELIELVLEVIGG